MVSMHSPVLQALGYSIINSLWEFALLWLIYVIINSIFKLLPRQKYVVGYALQVFGFFWFVITFANCSIDYGTADKATHLVQKSLFTIGSSANLLDKALGFIKEAELLLPYLSISYVALLIFLFCRYLYAFIYTKELRKNGLKEIDDAWKRFIHEYSSKLQINRTVEIYLSDLINTPLTVGFFKPLILIPVASINNLTIHQLEAVILHELAHIKRGDYIFNLLLAFVETILFFNPFMHLIARQIQRERENCCDDFVMEYEYNTTSYARALLLIASFQTPTPAFALKATDNKQILLTRVKRMIERKEKTFFNFRHQLMALLVMTIILGLPAFLMEGKQDNISQVDAFQKSINQKINSTSPFLNGVSYSFINKKSTFEKVEKHNPTVLFTEKICEKNSNIKKNLKKVISIGSNITENEVVLAQQDAQRQLNNGNELISENVLFPAETNNDLTSQLDNNYEEPQHVYINQEKALNKLKIVLKEMEVARQNGQAVQTKMPDGTERFKIVRLQKQLLTLAETAGKKQELQQLINHIQKEIKETDLENFFKGNLENQVNFQVPLVNFSPVDPKEVHSFSFEVSTAPKITLPPPPAKFKTNNLQKDEKHFRIQENEDQLEIEQLPLPPSNSIRRKEQRVRHLQVIRI